MRPYFLLLLLLGVFPVCAPAQRPVTLKHKRVLPQPAPMLLADPVEIIRRSTANEEQNARKGRDFTYSEIVVEKKLDSQGGLKSSESRTTEALVINGDRLERIVSKNGAALRPSDAAKEEDKIRQATRKYATETPEQRAIRLRTIAKSREDERALVAEIPEAFNFTLLPPETWNGHSCYVIQAEPKPGFQPRSKDGKYLPKFHARIWVDQKELQWAKLDLEMVDPISFGWFVARLNKGTHIEIEQARVTDDVWLPTLVHVSLQARVALVQDVNYDVTRTYRDYKNSAFAGQVSRLNGTRKNP